VTESCLGQFLQLGRELELKGLADDSMPKYVEKSSFDYMPSDSDKYIELGKREIKEEIENTQIQKDLIARVNLRMEKEDLGSNWRCKMCEKIMHGKKAMESHIETKHLTDIALNCDVCGKTFHARDSLRKHMDRNHKNDMQDISEVIFDPTDAQEEIATNFEIQEENISQNNISQNKNPKPQDILSIHGFSLVQGESKDLSENTFPEPLSCNQPKEPKKQTNESKEQDKEIRKSWKKGYEEIDAQLKSYIERTNIDGVKEYRCTICEYSEIVKSRLESHIERKHLNLSFPCPNACAAIIQCRDSLRKHIKRNRCDFRINKQNNRGFMDMGL
jgi:hypothetical protein